MKRVYQENNQGYSFERSTIKSYEIRLITDRMSFCRRFAASRRVRSVSLWGSESPNCAIYRDASFR